MSDEIKNKETLFTSLPERRDENLTSKIQEARKFKVDAVIVLDDDPTGTQTVSNVPVLTTWEVDDIVLEFRNVSPIFFILTNSRSLTEEEAIALATTIGENIRKAAEKTDTRFWVISRSDSTLRGHYPGEVNALEVGLRLVGGIHFFIPAFFEGGRYTINNIHYVQQGEMLIPAAQTSFAQDKVFGYKSSELRNWISEKHGHELSPEKIHSISIEELRASTLDDLVRKLEQLDSGSVCIINAADYHDLYFFTLAIMRADIKPLFRTAASFVAAISGVDQKPLLSGKSIRVANNNGGLIIVGSYVPTSSSQLSHLFSHRSDLSSIEIDVEQILNAQSLESLSLKYATQIDRNIKNGKTTVLFTSRKLVIAESEIENQEIGKRISHFITQTVAHLKGSPSFLITKGGITSSDIATKALGIKRAIVKGQIMKGVPVWELGKESKFPGSHQIIFPGNVGLEDSLTRVVEKLMK